MKYNAGNGLLLYDGVPIICNAPFDFNKVDIVEVSSAPTNPCPLFSIPAPGMEKIKIS